MEQIFQPIQTPRVRVERTHPEQGYTAAIRQAYQQGQIEHQLPAGYTIDRSFANNGHFKGKTGVQVTAVIDQETGERIIAFAGTDQLIDDPITEPGQVPLIGADLEQWPTLGRGQWEEASGVISD